MDNEALSLEEALADVEFPLVGLAKLLDNLMAELAD